ncbi:hypothetical protein ACFWGI_06865 [Streptomyces niveus]|uniref:hypothetical protein n=1 Tax=Streptomyces niveus TaxID=193462 RepID=UPI00365EC16A
MRLLTTATHSVPGSHRSGFRMGNESSRGIFLVGDESSRISFRLWNPVVSFIDERPFCVMDVTAIGDCLLNQGDDRTMQDFLSAVGVPGVTVTRWQIRSFCTQYYSDYPTRQDWRDRLSRAWRLEIGFDGHPGAGGSAGFGPFGVDARDSTFLDEDRDWIRGPERCLVIAEADRGVNFDFLRKGLRREYHVAENRYGSTESVKLSIDLGILNLPSEFDKVNEVTDICEAHGLRTHWTQTLHRYLPT